jgi:dihydrofolate reductase
VDELHLFVFPLALGTGKRLFGDGGSPVRLGLTAADSYSSGVVHLAYGRAE